MTKTACLHLRKTSNVGDLSCSPGDYFDFGQTDMLDFSDPVGARNLVILGGGKVFKHCVKASIYDTPEAAHRVVWGVGISQRDAASVQFDILRAGCDLISSRNWEVPDCDFVPCASAMSSCFDEVADPIHDVVLFLHAKKSEGLLRPDGVPALDNHGCTLKQALDFLASGSTVVTNSYHGTYWAMCLGRKVLCIPFNQKFKQFRENPVMSHPESWLSDISRAERRLGTLEDARARNWAFYSKVRNLV